MRTECLLWSAPANTPPVTVGSVRTRSGPALSDAPSSAGRVRNSNLLRGAGTAAVWRGYVRRVGRGDGRRAVQTPAMSAADEVSHRRYGADGRQASRAPSRRSGPNLAVLLTPRCIRAGNRFGGGGGGARAGG